MFDLYYQIAGYSDNELLRGIIVMVLQPQPLLVTGYMRSGTTLLANFLHGQSNITMLRDRFISLFRNMPGLTHPLDFNQAISTDVKALLRKSIEENLHTIFNAKQFETEQQMQDLWQAFTVDVGSFEFSTYGELLCNVLQQSAHTDDRYVGSKVTLAEHNAARFISQCGGKVITIVRHPYNVMSSLISKNFFDGAYYGKEIESIQAWKRGIARLIQLDGNEDFHWLRFESLVANADKEVAALSDFLQLPLQIELDNLIDYGLTWYGNSSFNRSVNLFDPSTLGRKPTISNELIAQIDELCAEELRFLGY